MSLRKCLGLGFASLALGLAASAHAGAGGNANAVLRGGTLRVTGTDALGVKLLLTGVPEGQMNAVSGFVRIVPDGSLVNGSPDAVNFDGVTALSVSLGDGPNDLSLALLGIVRGVSLRGGMGSDAIHFNLIAVGQNVLVNGRGGPLSFSCQDDEIIGNLLVRGGPSDDSIALGCGVDRDARIFTGDGENEVSMASNGFARSLEIHGGKGADELELNGLIERNVTLRPGLGANTLSGEQLEAWENLSYWGGRDSDTIELSTLYVGLNARIHLGHGANTCTLSNGYVGKSLEVFAGNDGDSVAVGGGEVVADARFLLGNGANSLTLNNVPIGDDLWVQTGRDDDTLVISGTTAVADKTTIRLGGGTNTGP